MRETTFQLENNDTYKCYKSDKISEYIDVVLFAWDLDFLLQCLPCPPQKKSNSLHSKIKKYNAKTIYFKDACLFLLYIQDVLCVSNFV